jgi:hypothetical protein
VSKTAASGGIEALLHGPVKAAHMNIERETVVEAGVSFAAVLVFIAAVVGVGTAFGTDGGNLSGTGGLAVLGAVVLFIAVMTGVGYWLSSQE